MTPEEALKKLAGHKYAKTNALYGRKSINFVELSDEEHENCLSIIKECPKSSCKYAVDVVGKRFKEAEKTILTNPNLALKYCLRLFRKRWKTKEDVILQASPKLVFEYFQHFNWKDQFENNCWIEAEPIFEKHLPTLYKYTKLKNIKSNSFEQKILNDPSNKENPKYIYNYCNYVIEKRWPEAEHILFTNTEYAAKYANNWKLTLPEETHNQIVAEVAFSNDSPSKRIYVKRIGKVKKIVQNYIEELLGKNILTINSPISELLK